MNHVDSTTIVEFKCPGCYHQLGVRVVRKDMELLQKSWNDAWLLLVGHTCQRCAHTFQVDWLRAMVRRELDEVDNLPF
jgi:hypothetical protein